MRSWPSDQLWLFLTVPSASEPPGLRAPYTGHLSPKAYSQDEHPCDLRENWCGNGTIWKTGTGHKPAWGLQHHP